ncbi:hypothetical protein M0R45_036607 [Rubus argutus]|uniref:Transcription termination factor MTERF6, chloroplastic/mitochondrial-like n=1 Tax=Rubus argutus TaxID=59490 RepID=A0AAW1VWP6_RUBAR
MLSLCKLRTLRLGYSIFSCASSSISKVFVVEDPKPPRCCFQNHLFCRLVSSEVSANQEQNSTVNYLINSCGLSSEGAISASKWLKLKSPERADSVLACFRNHGFSETQISMVVRSRPQVLITHFEKTLLPKLEYFSSLGVSREDLAEAVALNPALLAPSLEKQIIPAFKFLKSMVSEKTVNALLKKRSWIFLTNYCKTVLPNIRLLRELGMPQSCISLLLTHFTQLVILKHEKFAQLVQEVKEMGFNMEKSTSLCAINALGHKNSKSILNRSRQVYMRWGWSEDDILSAFRKFPQCMTLSEKKIMQVMDFLVNKMGWSSRMIAKHPVVWSYSLDKRIIPRCSVVKVLLLKGLIKENFSFSSVLCPVEKRFVDMYVTKFVDQVPQLSGVYQRKVGIWDV